jgi:hypothetical protein
LSLALKVVSLASASVAIVSENESAGLALVSYAINQNWMAAGHWTSA